MWPSRLFRQTSLHVCGYFLEFDEIIGRVVGVLKFINTKWVLRPRRRHSVTLHLPLCRCAFNRPAAPVEADDHGDNRANRCTLHKTLERMVLQN